jgi:hypothetical protein
VKRLFQVAERMFRNISRRRRQAGHECCLAPESRNRATTFLSLDDLPSAGYDAMTRFTTSIWIDAIAAAIALANVWYSPGLQ